jgi:hypothetical protein
MKQIITLSNKKTVTLVDSLEGVAHESGWDVYYVLHDDDMAGYSPDGRSPQKAPEVHKLGGRFVSLYEEYQRFWMSLNMNKAGGKVNGLVVDPEYAFSKYTGAEVAFTDYHDSDTYADYINRTNLKNPTIAIEYITCGGNILLGRKLADQRYVEVKYIDANNPPPFGISYWTHPHLIHHATIISEVILTGALTGKRYINPFPTFGGRNNPNGIIPVYFPIIGLPIQVPTIEIRKLKLIQPDPAGDFVINGLRYTLPNPYRPAATIWRPKS